VGKNDPMGFLLGKLGLIARNNWGRSLSYSHGSKWHKREKRGRDLPHQNVTLKENAGEAGGNLKSDPEHVVSSSSGRGKKRENFFV